MGDVQMGKISVIIPTHNRADILPRAIKSVQDQTRPVDEIIVVSDGSTDSTEEVVRQLAEKDSRIRLIAYHPGHNGNYARNKGIEAASGEFIAFLDDDDEWLPKKTELQMELFEKDPGVGLVYSSQNCIIQTQGSHIRHSRCGGEICQRKSLSGARWERLLRSCCAEKFWIRPECLT